MSSINKRKTKVVATFKQATALPLYKPTWWMLQQEELKSEFSVDVK